MYFTLARQGVYRSLQGEGALLGMPMVFVRFAGCSIACKECNVDYFKNEVVTHSQLVIRIENLKQSAREFVWLTGGEPTDQEHLDHLAGTLRELGHWVGIATAGTKSITKGIYDWISVSPHSTRNFVQNFGHELKITPGLNNFRLKDIDKLQIGQFVYKFIQPAQGYDPKECIKWVMSHQGWRLGPLAENIWRTQ